MDSIEIATSRQVTVFARADGFVSFFNSPYYAHGTLTGVDIYSGSGTFGSPALSPVKGRVRKIHQYRPLSSTWFKSPETGYLILIECNENPDVWVKILHVEPQVKEGDYVAVGDTLGMFMRDGFFHPWTNPHLHVEVRNPGNPIRATGGYPLTPAGTSDDPTFYGSNVNTSIFRGTVSKTGERYAIVDLEDAPFIHVGPFHGVLAESEGFKGILDGGIPHYQRAGLLGVETHQQDSPRPVLAWGVKVGHLHTSLSGRASLFLCDNLEVTLNNTRCIGFSCYLNLTRHQNVKVVLPDSSTLKVGEKTTLGIKPSEEPIEDLLHRAFNDLVDDGPWGKSLKTDRRWRLNAGKAPT